jgi:hypothetical protein
MDISFKLVKKERKITSSFEFEKCPPRDKITTQTFDLGVGLGSSLCFGPCSGVTCFPVASPTAVLECSCCCSDTTTRGSGSSKGPCSTTGAVLTIAFSVVLSTVATSPMLLSCAHELYVVNTSGT